MIQRTEKPWGFELIWAKTDKYIGKILHVNKGHALSLQYHQKKDESILILSGKIKFDIEENGQMVEKNLGSNESYHIKPGIKHRMTAIEDTDIAEVSTTELDDVVRLEDRYGRANKFNS